MAVYKDYNYAYLLMVDPKDNHNKFYEIQESANGCDVKYGRVGEKVMSHHYANYEKDFYTLYREKTGKGYKDVTRFHTEEQTAEARFKDEPYEDINVFAKKLYEARQQLLNKHYTKPADVNSDMIYAAREAIGRLEDCIVQNRPSWRFEEELKNLYHIIPRRDSWVKGSGLESIASDVEKQKKVIEKEKELIDALETQYKSQQQNIKSNGSQSLFESLNLEVRPCTYEEEDEIKKLMKKSEDKSECLTAAYRIVNKKTSDAYEKCCEDMKIPEEGRKLLFHGSGNGNWLSIIEKGLLLDPEAKITAKGLGHGIYFADDISKSLNYGASDVRYMGLYEVATGKAWDTNGVYIGHHYVNGQNFSFKNLKDGCQSVFLDGKKISPGHLNEYCIYKQEQCNIKYLIVCEQYRTKDVRFSMHLHLPFKSLEFDRETAHAVAELSDYAKNRLGVLVGGKEIKNAEAEMNLKTGKFSFTVNGKDITLTPDEESRLSRDFKSSFFESERDWNEFKADPFKYNEEKENEKFEDEYEK